MPYAERLAKRMANCGEQFTVDGTTYRGVFRLLDSGTMHTYLDDTEAMGVTHPGLMLVTEAEAAVSTGDTITRDGRTYTVLKTSQHRIGDVSVVKVAILA